MRTLLLSLVFAATAFTAVAHATNIPTSYTYDFTGTVKEGSMGSGTITADGDGDVTAANITFTSSSPSDFSGTLTKIVGQIPVLGGGYVITVTDGVGVPDYLNLFVSSPFSGAVTPKVVLGRNSNLSYDSGDSQEFLTAGTLTLEKPAIDPSVPPVSTAATPEPSSLILLGTGALGMAGAARRRFFPRA